MNNLFGWTFLARATLLYELPCHGVCVCVCVCVCMYVCMYKIFLLTQYMSMEEKKGKRRGGGMHYVAADDRSSSFSSYRGKCETFVTLCWILSIRKEEEEEEQSLAAQAPQAICLFVIILLLPPYMGMVEKEGKRGGEVTHCMVATNSCIFIFHCMLVQLSICMYVCRSMTFLLHIIYYI